MKQDKLEKTLQNKFNDFELEPDSGDWEIISRGIVNSPKRRVPILGYIAAAASVAVIISLSMYTVNMNNLDESIITLKSTEKHTDAQKTENSVEIVSAAELVEILKEKIDESKMIAHKIVAQDSLIHQHQVVAQEMVDKTEPENKSQLKPSTRRITTQQIPQQQLFAKETKKTRGNWSLSLFADGATKLKSKNGDNTSLMAMSSSIVEYNISNYARTAVEQANLKHSLPLTFGISVRKNITKKWGIETGISYSYLSSHSELNSTFKYNIKQRVHYIGVPIAITYTALRADNFELYARAGMSADFNIGTKRTIDITSKNGTTTSSSERFRSDDIQWSASFNVGLMYNISPVVGVYLEPGVGHYLSNDKQPQTYWSENPTNFGLKLGVRANF